ncbi:WRKY transcription factor 55-like [Musa acuminata AAA Group]|uniref:WRKY transcription factor 55-like n=1 Tax=Musa acuminata AAA Group TaxID=214697 RepID=UPI0031DA00F8
MFLCLADSEPKQTPMDEVLSQVFGACRLAGELESSLRLSNAAADAHFLLSSCEHVVDAFNKAIDGVRMLTGEGRMRAFELPPIPAAEDDEHPFFEMADFSESPQLSLEVQPSAAAHSEAFAGGGEAQVAVGGASSRGRSSRKRKEGYVTKKVPVLRTGNMEVPPDDGYTWRKYGQKDILNSRFPRSYYRCTHKNYYGCEAKKQVQRLDADPYTLEVTYCGSHTCKTSPTPIMIPSLAHSPIGKDEKDDRNCHGHPQAAPTTTRSTSIQLGNWFEGSSRQEGQTQGGRDVDYCPVAEFADAMFSSGSSGSIMDAIYLPRQGN